MNTYAVLIADVMESSARQDLRSILGKKLNIASERHLQNKLIKLPYGVTAGDEFQTITDSPQSIPTVILNLRATLRPLSIRVGVGLGGVSGRIQAPVNRLSGEAFQYARTAIDAVKTNSLFKFEVLTGFKSKNRQFDDIINLIYGLHDTLVLRIKTKQWLAIEEFIGSPNLEDTAKYLKRDTSTISRNLKRGYYWQLTETTKTVASLLEGKNL